MSEYDFSEGALRSCMTLCEAKLRLHTMLLYSYVLFSFEPLCVSFASFKAYTGILCEFLEVAFHQILFTRGVYPSGFFERRRKYGISVQVCVRACASMCVRACASVCACVCERVCACVRTCMLVCACVHHSEGDSSPSQMCRHPLLTGYIQNVLRGMVPLLNKVRIK